jgi:hypothetical protein
MSRGMLVKKLYILNDDADYEDMACAVGLMVAMGYRYVEHSCEKWYVEWKGFDDDELGASEDYVMDRICIEEVVFDDVYRDIDDVVDDLYYISTVKNINIRGMWFVAEVEDGYVVFNGNDVIGKVVRDFVEELRI